MQATLTSDFINDPDPKKLEGMPLEQAAQYALVGLFILIKGLDDEMQREDKTVRKEGI